MCSIPFCEQHFFRLGFVSLNSFSSNIFRYYLAFSIACSSNFCCRSYLLYSFSNFLCIFWILFVKSFVCQIFWTIKSSVFFFRNVLFLLLSAHQLQIIYRGLVFVAFLINSFARAIHFQLKLSYSFYFWVKRSTEVLAGNNLESKGNLRKNKKGHLEL